VNSCPPCVLAEAELCFLPAVALDRWCFTAQLPSVGDAWPLVLACLGVATPQGCMLLQASDFTAMEVHASFAYWHIACLYSHCVHAARLWNLALHCCIVQSLLFAVVHTSVHDMGNAAHFLVNFVRAPLAKRLGMWALCVSKAQKQD